MKSASGQRKSSAAEEVFAGGGEMGALMRGLNWSRTPLGLVEDWPQSLRTAVSILLNSRHPMFIFWGPQLAKLYNDGYRPILGAKHPGALGQPGPEVWPEIWDTIGPMVEHVLSQGEATWSDDLMLFMHRNGYLEEVYFTFSYSPIRDETGGVGGMFCACIETTERVLGERRLRTLRDLAARAGEAKTAEDACRMAADTLANSAADIPFALLYLIDTGGKIARLVGAVGLVPDTPASPGLVDLTAGESHDCWPLTYVADTGRAQRVDDLLARFGAFSAGPWPAPPHSALVLPIAQPGQDRPGGLLVAGVSPRRALDDNYRGFFDLVAGQVATAVANARAYEEERRRTEALAALDRAKSAFFGNVSHEFRTPLTLMLGPVEELLSDEQLGASQREQLAIVRRNGLRLLKLVNTLLDFSRIESGHVQVVYQPSDLVALTADLASVFRSAIERVGLRLVVDCQPLPMPIYVDREMWEKIVLNLLSNALKFTFEGEISVTLRQAGDHVELEVRDTGTGIPADELSHLFERFHRVRGARARTYEGSGIGLALVQELARLHGGNVRVSSVAGVGSAFTVAIPIGQNHLPVECIGAVPPLASTALGAAPYVEEALRWLPDESSELSVLSFELAREAQTQHSTLNTQHSARVLLADDNADMRDYLVRVLGQRWQVEAVADGAAALAAARARPPDLVLADVMMPGLDGLELLRELRADPRTRTVPIILLSARAGEEARVEGMEGGADDYLVKPFSARELLAHISGRLALARSRREIDQGRREHAEQLRKLAAAALAINATLSLEALLQLITEQAGAIIGAHQAVTSLTMNDNRQQPLNSIILSDKYAAWRGAAMQPDNSGISALVCRENRPLRLTQTELKAYPSGREVGDQDGGRLPMRGWLAAPLTTRDGRNIGLIQLSDKYAGEFTEEDESILVQLAQMASVAIENAQLYAAELQARRYIERDAERIAHLQIVTAMLAEALTPTEVAEVIVAQGLAALSARAGSVALLVDGDTALEIVSEFGYREELIGPWRHFSIDNPTPMSDAVRAASPVWLASLAERAARYPDLSPIASDDGAWVALPLLAKGRPIGAIGLSFAQPRIFDADDQAFMLTLAQQCAQALDRARLYVEAEAAVTARDELLSVVSHDLKNPLATVKGFAQLLRRRIARLDSPETARLLDGLDKIDMATTRMGKQIAELLDATRLHAGQPLDLDRQTTRLVALVRQVMAECQQTTQSHTIQLLAPDQELVGEYDPARLDRVFANLLQNAIKYSPRGGAIGVEVAREERDDASWAIVSVSDQGIGIPADDLPQIFERFHRAGNVAGQIQGTGIGLSSASQIVQQHGGTIDVVSQEGVGSTFTVRLPLEPVSSEC